MPSLPGEDPFCIFKRDTAILPSCMSESHNSLSFSSSEGRVMSLMKLSVLLDTWSFEIECWLYLSLNWFPNSWTIFFASSMITPDGHLIFLMVLVLALNFSKAKKYLVHFSPSLISLTRARSWAPRVFSSSKISSSVLICAIFAKISWLETAYFTSKQRKKKHFRR